MHIPWLVSKKNFRNKQFCEKVAGFIIFFAFLWGDVLYKKNLVYDKAYLIEVKSD